MLTNIVKATRAHYAALQHKPAADRAALVCTVEAADGTVLHRCTLHVKGNRRAALTRALNLHRDMFPEMYAQSAEFPDNGPKVHYFGYTNGRR
jgi:hypothetical protein